MKFILLIFHFVQGLTQTIHDCSDVYIIYNYTPTWSLKVHVPRLVVYGFSLSCI